MSNYRITSNQIFHVLNTQPNMLWNWRGSNGRSPLIEISEPGAPEGGGGVPLAAPSEWKTVVDLKNIGSLSTQMIPIKLA